MSDIWTSNNILVGVCGGIAAYKVCTVVSSLAKQEAAVQVVLTPQAETFVSPLTFAALSRRPAYTDQDFWSPRQGRPLHIELAEWADAILIAPLTANTLAKIVHGFADTLLTNLVMASTCPVLVAPAMNTQMWLAPPVQANWQQLLQDPRFWTVDPQSGRLACDTVGQGRLAEPQLIEDALLAMLWTQGNQDWRGKRILVSAGGTREPIDQVRFIGNPSSGRMGWALAAAAAHRGAEVTLVHTPSSFSGSDPGLHRISVTTAADMHQALLHVLPEVDVVFMAAAVGDVRPLDPVATKLPKAELPDQLPLERIPDILQDLNQQRRRDQVLVGFAAQVGDPAPAAEAKLVAKGLDAIVANPIDQPHSGFESPWNQAVVLGASGFQQPIPLCRKEIMAHRILDIIRQQVLKFSF